MWIIKLPILILVAGVWTVLGVLFWVPLLARSTAIYASTMLLANITGGSCAAHGERLELAVRFYSDGFRNILDSLYGDSTSTYVGDSPGLNLGRLLVEAIWTALFWGAVILLLGRRTPLYGVVHGAVLWIWNHIVA